jgi:hypothetical protein
VSEDDATSVVQTQDSALSQNQQQDLGLSNKQEEISDRAKDKQHVNEGVLAGTLRVKNSIHILLTSLVDEAKDLYLYMNTTYFQKKEKMESWDTQIQMFKIKENEGTTSTKEDSMLKVMDEMMDDMMKSHGTVKIGYTSQEPVKVCPDLKISHSFCGI